MVLHDLSSVQGRMGDAADPDRISMRGAQVFMDIAYWKLPDASLVHELGQGFVRGGRCLCEADL